MQNDEKDQTGFHAWFKQQAVTNSEMPSLSETWKAAIALNEVAMNHLGELLFMLADLHPDEQTEAYQAALAFFNTVNPHRKIEPTGIYTTFIVKEHPVMGVSTHHSFMRDFKARERRNALKRAANIVWPHDEPEPPEPMWEGDEGGWAYQSTERSLWKLANEIRALAGEDKNNDR